MSETSSGAVETLFQAGVGICWVARILTKEQSSCIMAAASFLTFMAVVVRRAWIFVLSRPLWMALASPWNVFAVPYAPSTRQQ